MSRMRLTICIRSITINLRTNSSRVGTRRVSEKSFSDYKESFDNYLGTPNIDRPPVNIKNMHLSYTLKKGRIKRLYFNNLKC